MARIAFFEIEKWEEEHIRNNLSEHDLYFTHEKLNEKNASLVREAEVISTFIYSQVTKGAIDQFPKLKLITTRSTGFEHIDLSYCKEKHITVSNVPSYGEHTVAEHTFALILALSRKIIPSVEKARRGDFSLEKLRGFNLFGKTIGVIGAGTIGKRVIQIAHGFGMKIVIYTRTPDTSLTQHLGIEFVDLPTLLRVSDIVSLHCPYTKETHHMINMSNIKQFKKGSILVNTARGGLVETQALLQGLEEKILQGAGIDVLEEECSLREERELLTDEFLRSCDIKTQLLNHVLLTRDDVIITPHNAFNSTEALAQILETTAFNIQNFLSGKPRNEVT